MTEARRARVERRMPAADRPLRLDLLTNPFGPSLRVQEALASSDELHLPLRGEIERLRARIAAMHGLQTSWVAFGNGIDELIAAGIGLTTGPVALFPPTDPAQARLAGHLNRETIELPRSHRFAIEVDPATLSLPERAIGLALTPNDPTGTILSAQEAVRLSRKCAYLMLDERHAAYSPRTLIPLVREFDNVVVLRTFETWAALEGLPIAYAVAPPKLAAEIEARRLRPNLAAGPVIAAHATLDDLPMVTATVERTRDEKGRLYRTLRKLNMVRPMPSWANFLLARVERGEIEAYDRALRAAGIAIHRPPQAGLERYFRVSGTSAEATMRLKNVLIDAAKDL